MIVQSSIDRANAADLLVLAGSASSLKRVGNSEGGEYAGPCPMCGGRDRFHVQPARGRWLCRHCTEGKWNDTIALYRAMNHCSFDEAVRALGGCEPDRVSRPAPSPLAPPSPESQPDTPPTPVWQHRAYDVIVEAQRNLWAADTGAAEVRRWLGQRRGLSRQTLRLWQVGWIPQAHREPPEWWGLPADNEPVYISAGVLIPCVAADTVWYLKVRRLEANADPKYVHVRGSRPALYLADTITDATRIVVLVEGEFDGLVMLQSVRARAWPAPVAVATFGAATNRLRPPWTTRLAGKQIMTGYDADEAGEAATAWWAAHSPGAVRLVLTSPQGGHPCKDITEYLKQGGRPSDLVAGSLPAGL